MPESFWHDPLMYQGGSDDFLPPRAPIPIPDESWGIDMEAEVAVITDDVPMGVSEADAAAHIGQILGGQLPQAASGYQVMIYFAIGASSCLTAILMSLIVTSGIYGIKDSIERASDKQKQPPVLERSLRLHSNSTTAFEKGGSDTTILEVKNLTLPSTSLTIPSFIIGKHSRIGVVGRSGVGKTRFLRALSKLEDS